MPDYQNSKIYKLVSNKTSDIYIGSCLMRLSTRLSGHKSKSNKAVSRNLFINDAIITIVLIEKFPCNTKNELKARELYYITANNCINANKPFVCEIPYGDGKEYDKIYNKEYYSNHKENHKEYYQVNREHISAQKKIYDDTHREQISAQKKKYYHANKEQITTRRRTHLLKKKLSQNLESTLNNNIVL